MEDNKKENKISQSQNNTASNEKNKTLQSKQSNLEGKTTANNSHETQNVEDRSKNKNVDSTETKSEAKEVVANNQEDKDKNVEEKSKDKNVDLTETKPEVKEIVSNKQENKKKKFEKKSPNIIDYTSPSISSRNKKKESRGNRKYREGIVVSDKMNKTIVVRINYKAKHPLYKKIINISKKFKAHDEKNECKIGDRVLICETRPLSKEKCWRLVKITEKAK